LTATLRRRPRSTTRVSRGAAFLYAWREEREAAVRIEQRIEKGGAVIHRAVWDADSGMTMADFARHAHQDFAARHPEISLLDSDVWIKWDKAREDA
jgi:hypothetical protein